MVLLRTLARGFGSAVAASLLTASSAFAITVVDSGYFGMRTVINYGGGVIDSVSENELTMDQQHYNNAPTALQSEISLNDGALRSFVSVDGGGEVGFVNNQFGDTVTLLGGAGTTAEFSLAVDGVLDVDAVTEALNSYQATVVTARLALFDASAGATIGTWFDMSFGTGTITALDTDFYNFTEISNTEALFMQIDEMLSVSTQLVSNSQSLSVFAQLDLVGIRNANPGTSEMDFMNTAQLGITTGPGVSFTSASGVLLAGQPVAVVPLPAAGWLLLAGLGGLALRRGRVAG